MVTPGSRGKGDTVQEKKEGLRPREGSPFVIPTFPQRGKKKKTQGTSSEGGKKREGGAYTLGKKGLPGKRKKTGG